MKTPRVLKSVSVLIFFGLATAAFAEVSNKALATALDAEDADSVATSSDEIPAQARDGLRELLAREVNRRPAIDGPPIYSDDPKEVGMLNLDYSDEVPPFEEQPRAEQPAAENPAQK